MRVKLNEREENHSINAITQMDPKTERKGAEMKLTGKPRTQNSHGRLNRLKHLENLGLKIKTERKGKKTEG